MSVLLVNFFIKKSLNFTSHKKFICYIYYTYVIYNLIISKKLDNVYANKLVFHLGIKSWWL